MTFRAAVVRFPGSNCDQDVLTAARRAGAEAYFVWHRDTDLQGADAVLLPGGFSYGDYLRSGAIARFSPIMQEVKRHADRGGHQRAGHQQERHARGEAEEEHRPCRRLRERAPDRGFGRAIAGDRHQA